MESSALAWVSPFAWAENVRPFADDALGPLVLALTAVVVLVAAAALLQATRDVGAGLLAARPGRATARSTLSSPLGLAWRLSAGSLLAWAVGAAVVGALATSLGPIVEEVATGNPAVTEILGRLAAEGSMDRGLIITFFVMVGVLAACFGVQTVQRARQEEAHGTAEPTLAGAVHRSTWLGAFLAVALIGIVVIVGAAVGTAAIALAASGGDAGLVSDAVVAGAGQVAAASVFAVLTAVVFAVLPRATVAVGWSLVLVAACLALFGTVFGLDEAVVSLSPFAATPLPDGDAVDANGIWWLIVVALGGAAAALALMRRRELAAGG
jgi:ABC-2 type transport system permease protein